MGFKDRLIENVINPSNSQNLSNSIGKILSYDSYLNKANVSVSSSGKYNLLEGVPVQLSGKGLMSGMPKEGDIVYIQYNNGSVFQPKIVGFADEDYQNNTREKSKHMRKGTLLRDISEVSGDLVPRAKRRIDNSNDPTKHFDYKEADATELISEKAESLGRFNGEELGLFHPVLSSLIKLKDNGDIDIFTGTNVGVRINRRKGRVELYGDIYANGEKLNV